MLVPFHLSESWFDCWFAAYRNTPAAYLPVAEGRLYHVQDKRKVGPLSFKVTRGATNLQTAYFDICGTGDAEAAAGAAARLIEATGADMLEFDYVLKDALLYRAAETWAGSGWTSIEPLGRTALVDCSGRFDDWLAGRRKSDRRAWLKSERQMPERGLSYELVTGAAEAESAIPELLDVEASGWKGAAGSAIRHNPEDAAFYASLTRRAAEQGALHLAMVRHEGRAVAFDYGILSGDRCLALKASYREEYKVQSIGHVAAMKHVRDMFARDGIRYYDNMGNGLTPQRHKVRFATHYQLFYRIRVFAPTARGLLLREACRAYRGARAVRDRIRPKPSFEPSL
ncbi:MAG TPA: GNAT family N-acetyltransferase [Allosphingosinicella sp.]|jgi:CelD/BcsL family acetyltransferase involved in cellulose biosynthesis